MSEAISPSLRIMKSMILDCVVVTNGVEDCASVCYGRLHPRCNNIDMFESRRGSYTKLDGDRVRKLCMEGRLKEALHVAKAMVQQNSKVHMEIYICLLKACARRKCLAEGKQVHALMVQSRGDLNLFLANNLIDMYSKCGALVDASKVFTTMTRRNLFSWTAIISAYANNGKCEEAIRLFDQMIKTEISPDKVAFVIVLKACARIAALDQGKQLHSLMIQRGIEFDVIVQSTLVDMYAKCGSLEDARQLFNNMSERNVVSWNSMISGYAHNGLGEEALALYEQMKQEDMQADKVTFLVLLKACASISALEQGKQLHSLILKNGFELDMVMQSTLLHMYAMCGCLEDAQQLFNDMRQRDVVTWNSMISGYAQRGLGNEALALYDVMKREGVQANKTTFVVVLKACASIAALEQGKEIHSDILKRGFDSDVTIDNTLVDMYARCGCLEEANTIFNNMRKRTVVSWTAMIGGYTQNGLGKEALELYEQMKQEGVQLDEVTLVVILKACASVAALEKGRQVHSLIQRRGFESDETIQSALVDMYAKCKCVEDARALFNNMREPDVVSWNAMIAGYAQNGFGREALELYEEMKQKGVKADKVTFIVVLNACASIAALEQGKEIHALILNRGFELDVTVQNVLVDMYAKCGCLETARELFNSMGRRDLFSWTAIIAGYALNGFGKEALALYERMRSDGVHPNEVTYTSVLSACRHSGLVKEGHYVFDSMTKYGEVTPTREHYSCMVDLLGRAGFLAKAEDLIMKMPIQPDCVIWMSLLDAARSHGNVEIGRRAFDCVVKLEPWNAAPYSMLIDICSAAGRMDEVDKIRKGMKENHMSAAGLNRTADCISLL